VAKSDGLRHAEMFALARTLERELSTLQTRIGELRELLQRSRRYVTAHDYRGGGMRLGPPPVGAVLRDVIAAIDAALKDQP
jgi:hypothetical protein